MASPATHDNMLINVTRAILEFNTNSCVWVPLLTYLLRVWIYIHARIQVFQCKFSGKMFFSVNYAEWACLGLFCSAEALQLCGVVKGQSLECACLQKFIILRASAWQTPRAGGVDNFTFFLCPLSEDATLYCLSVADEHFGVVHPTVSAFGMSPCWKLIWLEAEPLNPLQ